MGVSYEHRLVPIYLGRSSGFYSPVFYNQDRQLSGSRFSGVITKRIYKGFGVFYRLHVRYDHLYFKVDTSNAVSNNVQAWLVDHMLGVSHMFRIGERGHGFLVRLGLGFMNRGSNYALVERITLPNFPANIYQITEHEFHYSASTLETKWIWQKFGLGLNVYHGTRSRFRIASPFIQIGLNFSYGIY